MTGKVMKPSRKVGIEGWGAYIPRYRIKNVEIARVWKGGVIDGNGVFPTPIEEKSVINLDEDTVTMAIEAARNALRRAGIDPKLLRTVLVGTESNPYAVKTIGATVARALGVSEHILSATYEFACKAGTEALETVIGLVGSGMIEYGLAIGADTAQGRPADELEYTAACGAAAYILGPYKEESSVALIEASYSYVSDTPDFWRRSEEKYPRHFYRFTGAPAYFKHIINAAKGLMEELGYSPDDFDYAVFHQPNYKFPITVAKQLGFPMEKVVQGIVVHKIGNTYAASALMGLAATLDVAKPGSRILVVSYGSGSGSDAFSIVVNDAIEEKREKAPKVWEMIEKKKYVDYALYARMRQKLLR
ncbi:MAG: hydroxymethylglutaryl-CoA synthase [Candidatus Njordarchaeales archaeon]